MVSRSTARRSVISRATGLAALSVLLAATGGQAAAHERGRVQEAVYQSIGGIDQWVTMRGDDAGNPVMLLIHGGPGAAQSALVATYSPYEKDFVLVQWDQRGAGRTFAKLGARTPELTLERQVLDGVELAEYVRSRFIRNRLVLVGHSWGSVVAIGMAQRRPDLFAAYVGTGQMVSWSLGFEHQKDFLIDAASRRGDDATLARLRALGRPEPADFAQFFGIVARYMGPADATWLSELPGVLASAPGMSEADLQAIRAGQNFSGSRLMAAIPQLDLLSAAPRLSLPYCLIQGDEDLHTPTAVAELYFSKVTVPQKRMSRLQGAGHFALTTHPAEFIAALKECPGVDAK